MKNKIGWLKITVCAAFFLLFVAAFFFSSVKISAVKTDGQDSENPQNCAACHQAEYDSWHRTSHRKTVRKATSETIRGDFTNENQFEAAALKAELRRDGEDYFVKIGDDSYKISAVIGAKFVEQYVGEKDGEFYSLPVGFHLTEKRWFFLNDTDFAEKSADVSRHLQNWKTDCAACHQPNVETSIGNFQDFGVSCDSCHGNAAEHLAAKNSFWAKLGFSSENKTVNSNHSSSDAAMLACAGCHSRDLTAATHFRRFSGDENPPELVAAHQTGEFNSERFWANGENKFSGNEFQAIVRSVCYAQTKAGGHGISGEKISCANCHSAHESNGESVVSEKSYNQNCINCHSQFSDDAAIVEHTKHPLDSEASNCASCHQPETVFGRTRFIRTHEISVPNPSLTVEKQIPNACNLCHTDQSVNWAIASSKKLWAERFRDAEISPDKQFNRPEGLRTLSADDDFSRALAVYSLQKHSDSNWSARSLFEMYQTEKSPLVRQFLAAAVKPIDSDPSQNFNLKKWKFGNLKR